MKKQINVIEWANNTVWKEHFSTSHETKDLDFYKKSLINQIVSKLNISKNTESILDPSFDHEIKIVPNIEDLEAQKKKEYENLPLKKLENIYLEQISHYFPNPYQWNISNQEDKIIEEKRQQIYFLLAQKENKRNEVTETIVDFIKKYRIIKTTITDKEQEVFYYKEGIYIDSGITEIKRLIRLLLDELYTSQLGNLVVERIKLDTLISSEELFRKQEEYPYLVPVNNGLLNVVTKELESFDKDIYFFSKLSIDYNKNNSNTLVERFIDSIVASKDDKDILQEIIGYGLLRDYRFEKAFMLYGDGRNGKGKLLNLITALFGKKNISNVPLNELEAENNFRVCELHNKFFNFSADVNETALNNTGIFRSLTGRDEVTANRKFLEPVTFVNSAKMLFATNGLPQPRKVTTAFWLRWVLVEFPFTFLPQKELDALEKNGELTEFHKLQDPTIIEGLTTTESLEGALLWALDGLERLLNNKDFSFKKSMNELKDEWLRKSNSLIAFCNDSIVESSDEFLTKASFKRYYTDYCKKHKVSSVSDRVISGYLTKEMGVYDDRTYIEDGGISKQIRVWRGIRLRLLEEVESQEVLS